MSIAWQIRAAHIERHYSKDWEIRRIGDLVNLTNGHPFPSDSFGSTGEIPLVRIRELVTLTEDFNTYVSGYIPPECILEDGDIVVGMDGDFNVVRWLRGKAALNQRLCRLRPRPGVDIRFIGYALPSILGIINDLTFSTTVKHLSSSDILTERIPLPPITEQRRIADFLDAETAQIDRLQAARDRQLSVLDELATSRMSAIVPSSSQAAYVRLGYLAGIQSGVTVDGNRDAGPDAVTLPYLRVANVQDGHVDLESVTEITVPRVIARSSTLKYGDVLMTEGGDLDKLGRGTVWLNEIQNCLHQNHVFAVRPDQGKLFPEYLALLTRTSYARAYFESTGTKTTNLASTSSSKIRDFRIPLIDIAEQERIVRQTRAWLQDIAKAQSALRQQSALLAERRQALITAAVTGQIGV